MSVEYRQVCSQADEGISFITESSSSDTSYTTTVRLGMGGVSYACSCPGYIYRGKCKHVQRAVDENMEPCCWQEGNGSEQTPQQEMEGVCPDCGSLTEVKQVEI